jgi:hypothetical protein
VIFGGGLAASYGLSRRRSSQYERVYGRPLTRKWSILFAFGIWAWVGLFVGLTILFPRYWLLTWTILLVMTWCLFMVVMLRVRRGIRSDPSSKPNGFVDAFTRGSKRGR